MIKLLNGDKISFYNYFYLFCIVIYAGSATLFARSLGELTSLGNIFAILMTIIFCYKNSVCFTRRYWVPIVLFSIYAVATFINNKLVTLLWLTQWYTWITIAYVICYEFKNKLFVAYESIIYKLSIIGLIIWILYLVYPDLFLSFVKHFHFSTTYNSNIETYNTIFYTFLPNRDSDFVFIQRNTGFAWEPGAYSCFLCLAIFCNMIRSKMSLKNNKSLYVLLLSLLSTQATTGFLIFILMMLCWLLLTSRKLYAFILIPLLVGLFNLPFVHDKLMEEYKEIENVNINELDDDTSHSMGRLMSLKLDYEEFLRHPILGLGGYAQGTWLHQNGYDNIATISGIGKLLSRFGIIMSLVFILLVIQSSRAVTRQFNSRFGYMLIVVILGSMISYNLWCQPCFIMFWMYGIFYKPAR